MFKKRRRLREDEEWDISRIIPKVVIIPIADEPPDEEALVKRFSIEMEERLKRNMRQSEEDACMLEKIINNKL